MYSMLSTSGHSRTLIKRANSSETEFETYRQEVTNLSQTLLHEIRDELMSYTQEIQLIADSGDPADSIIRTAEETQIDLIILGHRGMTPKSSFLLGGVSLKVATYAPCSVLICKERISRMKSILLAIDGSDVSNKAIEFLAAAPFKNPLRVIINTVWAPPPLGTSNSPLVGQLPLS